MDPLTHTLMRARTFDNEEDENAPHRMVEFIDDIPEGSIVLLLNTNCLHDNMDQAAYESLMKIGVDDLESEEDVRTLLVIGQKGLPPGKADFIVGKRNEAIYLTRNLPVSHISMQLEPTRFNIRALLDLSIAMFHELKFSRESDARSSLEESISRFSATLRVFTCNLLNILSRVSHSNISSTFIGAEEKNSLQSFILQLVVDEYFFSVPIVSPTSLMLFSITFDFLYPLKADKLRLAEKYIEKYLQNTCVKSEIALLEVILVKLSDARLFIDFDENGKFSFVSAMQMLSLCSKLIKQEQAIGLQSEVAVSSNILQRALSLFGSVAKLLVACDFESNVLKRVREPSVSATSQPETMAILKVMSLLSTLGVDFLHLFTDWKKKQNKILPIEDLAIVQQSVVGTLFPFLLLMATEILSLGGFKLINACMETMLPFLNHLIDINHLIHEVLSFFPDEAKEYTDSVPTKTSQTKVFESEHPYRSNMDERTNVNFPGAVSVTISFDSMSRTENSCDYVQFLGKDGNPLHDDIEKFSGRDGSEVRVNILQFLF